MSVPSNLVPTRILQLPEDPAPSDLGWMMYVNNGVTYKVQVNAVLNVSGVPGTRTVTAGTGLTGGGALSSNITISVAPGGIGGTELNTTGVAAGVYGDASNYPVITIDANGRVTAATELAIPGGGGSGTVTSVSVVSANGLAGTVATSTTTPAITLSTTITGLLQGNGTALSAATIGTGLSFSAGTLTNTAPDQVVSLTAGANVTITGTYPSFTIASSSGGTTTFPLTIGTGLSGTSFNGSAAVTIANAGVLSNVASTGISVSSATGNVTITNTAPDQVVSLTGAGTTVVTGTYPSFTITSSGGSGGGDVSGPGVGVGVTDNALVRWDGTTGMLVQNSVVVLTDTGDIYGATISGGFNTLTDIPNGALTNSSITINGTPISLGGTVTTGTVTSVSGAGTVNGLTLTGTVTTSGSLTLGGTLDLSSPPTIGNTAPNTGAFTTLIGGAGSANYLQQTGAVTTETPLFQALGTDTNISLAFESKGTGAIDLASGSKGVNVSNGDTVTAITRVAGGTGYTVAPTVTISAPNIAGGVQATATCTVTAGVVNTTFTITNAGSGYLEQPTITLTPVSGGAGATAYASIGAGTIIRSLGSTGTQSLDFYTPSGLISGVPQFRIRDTSGDSYWTVSTASAGALFTASGGTNATATIVANGSGFVSMRTQGGSQAEQLRVSNTTSAVDYVQITGSTTGNKAVTISAQGSDTDVDLALTPKGTGNVRFGTYTASVLTPTGYIEIKDSGGTLRRLLVG